MPADSGCIMLLCLVWAQHHNPVGVFTVKSRTKLSVMRRSFSALTRSCSWLMDFRFVKNHVIQAVLAPWAAGTQPRWQPYYLLSIVILPDKAAHAILYRELLVVFAPQNGIVYRPSLFYQRQHNFDIKGCKDFFVKREGIRKIILRIPSQGISNVEEPLLKSSDAVFFRLSTISSSDVASVCRTINQPVKFSYASYISNYSDRCSGSAQAVIKIMCFIPL